MPNQSTLRLLPNYYKKIGLALVVLTGLTFVFLVTVRPEAVQKTKDLVKLLLVSALILAMMLIAIARDKMEDELTQLIRLKSMAFSFLYAIGSTLVYPLITLVFDGSGEKISSHELVFNMLLIYLITFSALKYFR